MSITIEGVIEPSPEVHDLIGELNELLGIERRARGPHMRPINVTTFLRARRKHRHPGEALHAISIAPTTLSQFDRVEGQ
jgi:hypothetical protein